MYVVWPRSNGRSPSRPLVVSWSAPHLLPDNEYRIAYAELPSARRAGFLIGGRRLGVGSRPLPGQAEREVSMRR